MSGALSEFWPSATLEQLRAQAKTWHASRAVSGYFFALISSVAKQSWQNPKEICQHAGPMRCTNATTRCAGVGQDGMRTDHWIGCLDV